jgi:FemAB-related protein (PEP-CTERM system-associated)
MSDKQIEIRELTEHDAPAWEDFVTRHPHASPFHLLAWKRTIEESFPYKSRYLLAIAGDQVRGVLPLFLVQNPIVGKILLSTPFAVYGGILADSPDVLRALHERVTKFGAELGVDYVELRNSHLEQCGGDPNVDRYVAFSKVLTHDEQALMESLPKKTRNMVRKALKQPFEVRYGARDNRLFDRLHSRNMRRLGTPNFPRQYFDRLLANFGEMADVREVWLGDKLMAASINIYFRADMHTYHAAADTRHNALSPNTFMYFDHLRWAGQHGFSTFDFGRCKRNTGVFEFKKHWDTVMRQLPYEIILINRKSLPNFSPTNPRFDLPIRIWKLLPLPVTRAVSRFIFPLFP